MRGVHAAHGRRGNSRVAREVAVITRRRMAIGGTAGATLATSLWYATAKDGRVRARDFALRR
jgi:hypothetical protein